MSGAPEALGERLRMAREGKGLSAQKAADELHLDGWVIEALEGGDYARIGPEVYGRGHLKRYALLLGLPAAEILEAYNARASAPPAAVAPATSLSLRAATPADRRVPWAALAGVVVASTAVAGVLGWHYWSSRSFTARAFLAMPRETAASAAAAGSDTGGGPAAATPPAATAVDETPAGATPADATLPAASRAVKVNPAVAAAGEPAAPRSAEAAPRSAAGALPAAAAGLPDPGPAAGAGHARLRLSFSADSWIEVSDAAGRRLFAGKGLANSVKSIAGDAPFLVYLGFVSGVQLEVNNHAVAIGRQFLAGDVARFEVGADGVLRRDPHTAVISKPHPRG